MEYADVEIARARGLHLRNSFTSMGYDTFNPYTDEGNLLESFGLSSSPELIALKSTDLDRFLFILREIRKADMLQLYSSDAVVAFLDKSARGGVVGELTVAAEENIPVYSIVVAEDIPHISGWTLSCSDKMFWNIDECLEYIRKNPII